MWELVHSLLALRDPSHAALHVPWLQSLSGRLHGLALEPAVALTPPRGYTPDFLLPEPTGPIGDVADDLARLRATPAAQIRADMTLFAIQHPRGREIARAWLAQPRRELRRLADLLEAYWARAIEPVWPRVRAFLDADIAHRARRLAAGGPEALFADLSTEVAWRQPHLDVTVPAHDATVRLDGRGLLLVPSAFSASRPFVIDRAPWQPTLSYPARGIATLWEQAAWRPTRPNATAGHAHVRRCVDLLPRARRRIWRGALSANRHRVAPPERAARRSARRRTRAPRSILDGRTSPLSGDRFPPRLSAGRQ